jgi:hypothetical protein
MEDTRLLCRVRSHLYVEGFKFQVHATANLVILGQFTG